MFLEHLQAEQPFKIAGTFDGANFENLGACFIALCPSK
ncbi:MAG: hypothetical protein OZSIB_1916 [Candidatus Ozemobacter sibiricus]|uniref:Uncharacterized protein n=1 Tax=Candidatus Ozemobacter sibiricus TaxID=2268124 RepID=A0A367ZJH7_9BACT|nr:MAG: hypothetical protein OZSIB_1916 [Candidatus Ozemobacter sibiricus]